MNALPENMLTGWFTVGVITFITENERRDGKGSFLSVYIAPAGGSKGDTRKAKVWAVNYQATDEGFALKTEGGFAPVEVGTKVTAFGTDSTYTDAEGNQRVGFVLTSITGVEALAEEVAEA